MTLDALQQRLLEPDIQQLIRSRAHQVCRANGFRKQDHEDLVQELTLRLLRRLPSYQPERASLYCFALVVLDRVSKHLIQARGARCRDRSSTISMDTTFVEIDQIPVPLSELIDDRDRGNHTGQAPRSPTEQIDLKIDLPAVLEAAPERLQQLARELLTSKHKEIAQRFQISPETLRRWIAQLRAEFEKSGWNGRKINSSPRAFR